MAPTIAVTAHSGTVDAVAQPIPTPTTMPGITMASTRRSKLWR